MGMIGSVATAVGLREFLLDVGRDSAMLDRGDVTSCSRAYALRCRVSKSSSKGSYSSKCSNLRAPTLSRMSCVSGNPLGADLSGRPDQWSASIARWYNVRSPLTSCCCCCSSISTYLGRSQRTCVIAGTGNDHPPFGIDFVVRLLAFTEHTNSIVCPTPTARATSITLKTTCEFAWSALAGIKVGIPLISLTCSGHRLCRLFSGPDSPYLMWSW